MRSQRRIKFKKSKSKLSDSVDTRVTNKENIAKCAFGNPISKNRRRFSADDLSVFSSALRPCLALLILGLAAISVTSPAYAEDASMTLSVPSVVDLSLKPGEGIRWKPSKITIKTNAAYGYTLGIKAVTSGNDLTSEENNTISSITSNTKDLPANSWGWRHGEWEGTAGDPESKPFGASPTTSITNIATTTTSTNNTDKDYYLTIGANVDTDQPKGTYTKDFVITATATEKQYSIVYNLNGGTTATGGDTSTNTYTSNVSFTTATSSKTGYFLKGWCSIAPDATKGCTGQDSAGNTAKICEAGKACALTLAGTGDKVNLYAVWETPFEKAGASTMQAYGKLTADKKKEVLNNITTVKGDNFQYELTDERDNRLYFISKLADGNLWMTENLDLALATNKTLTTSNTDIPVNWTPMRSTIATGATGWTDDNSTPYSYDPGNRCWNGTFTSSHDLQISDDTTAKSCNKHDSSHYYVGDYYNWNAAVAMNNTSSYTTNQTNVNQSICPKGWQLPVYSGSKSFINLKNAVADAGGTFTSGPSGTMHKAPFYFTYGGSFDAGISNDVGYESVFWSSVVRSSTHAYYLDSNYTGRLVPQFSLNRSPGFSVRCVARTGGTEDFSGPKTIADISTMQQWGNLPKANRDAIKASMTTNTQYEKMDERDGRWYYIAKLADGNIWMTENLDLDLSTSKTLTPNDTDITANWTPTRNTLTALTSWSNDNNTPYSYDPGNRCWNGTMINSANSSISDTTVAKDCNKHDSSHYHVGNYYNWSAAVAMNSTSSYTTDKQNPNQSICPKGWQLPVYSGNKSFFNLKTVAALTSGTSGTVHQAPFYFPYSGYVDSGLSGFVGYVGYFWSSVTKSSSNAYYLDFNYTGSLASQASSYYRYTGRSVRCVARDE